MIYDLVLSKGTMIKIDEDDLEIIKQNISSSLIQIKQGIFNPSFMIAIIPTESPDVIKKPIIDNRGISAVITGERKVKVLQDLMSSGTKKLT